MADMEPWSNPSGLMPENIHVLPKFTSGFVENAETGRQDDKNQK